MVCLIWQTSEESIFRFRSVAVCPPGYRVWFSGVDALSLWRQSHLGAEMEGRAENLTCDCWLGYRPTKNVEVKSFFVLWLSLLLWKTTTLYYKILAHSAEESRSDVLFQTFLYFFFKKINFWFINSNLTRNKFLVHGCWITSYNSTKVHLWMEGFIQNMDLEQWALFDFLGQMLSSRPRGNLDRDFLVGRGLESKRRRQAGVWANSRLVTNRVSGKQKRGRVLCFFFFFFFFPIYFY